MEHNFRVRVDRAFGMLSAAASADVSPALWCLTDEEIERREWNRNKDDEVEIEKELNRNDVVISRTFISESQLESDLKEPSDNEDDEEEPENEEDVNAEKSVRRCGDDAADEFLDVRANMGRDCTLDEEEEEDEYDKVAIGKDHNGDCLYMRDVKYAYYEIEESTMQSELPNSFESTFRDPRANHEAANARLKEDAEASGGFDTLQLSDVSFTTHTDTMNMDHYSEAELDVDKLKPILMKDSESLKPFGFTVDPNGITEMNDEQHLSRAGGDLISTINNSAVCEPTSEVSDDSSGVPDYIKNPSRYLHYTFNSTKDMDYLSNRNAYMDFFSSLRRKKSGDNGSSHDDVDDVSAGIPTSIAFTPRKKSEGDTAMKNESCDERKRCDERKPSDAKNKGPSLVAEDEAEEVSAMEVDDEAHAAVNKGFTLQKSSGRKYRTKTGSDADDDTHMHD